MVTANELLKSITNSEAEGHIVIGIDRHIIVPAALKRIAVQYDHNVETVTFDCPRYWDELDMSKMAIYINYMRSDGYADRYPVTNVTVDNNIMHFNWTISRNVTEVKGVITFLVCVKKTDAEGNEVNHWNSELCQDMFVSEGMETEEQISDLSSDLVTQLLLRMDSVEQINIQASEMENILAETTAEANRAEAARDLAVDAEGNIKNSYANAIKGKVSGEIIRVDDVSPIEHDVKCKVHGKNLCVLTNAIRNPARLSYDESTQTFTVVEAGFVQNIRTFDTPYPVGTNVAVTLQIESGEITGTMSFGGYHLNSDGTSNWQGYVTAESGIDLSGKTYTTTFTSTDTITDIVLFVDGAATVNTPIVLKAQFEIGDIPTEYEPYVDPTTITVKKCGKAIFSKTSQTVSGVSKPWTSLLVAALQVPPGNYVAGCRFNQVGQDTSRVSMSPRSYNDYSVPLARDTSLNNSTDKSGYLQTFFTVGEEHGGFQIFLYSNTPNEPLTTECLFEDIYVEAGSVATGYEQYNGETYTPNSDGTINITSISPTMTIFTNTPGVTVEAEYNRDTTKAMTSYIFTEEIKDEIAAKVEDDMAEVLASLNSYATSLIGGDS